MTVTLDLSNFTYAAWPEDANPSVNGLIKWRLAFDAHYYGTAPDPTGPFYVAELAISLNSDMSDAFPAIGSFEVWSPGEAVDVTELKKRLRSDEYTEVICNVPTQFYCAVMRAVLVGFEEVLSNIVPFEISNETRPEAPVQTIPTLEMVSDDRFAFNSVKVAWSGGTPRSLYYGVDEDKRSIDGWALYTFPGTDPVYEFFSTGGTIFYIEWSELADFSDVDGPNSIGTYHFVGDNTEDDEWDIPGLDPTVHYYIRLHMNPDQYDECGNLFTSSSEFPAIDEYTDTLDVPALPAAYNFQCKWDSISDVDEDDTVLLAIFNEDEDGALLPENISHPLLTFNQLISQNFDSSLQRLTIFTATIPSGFDPANEEIGRFTFGTNTSQDTVKYTSVRARVSDVTQILNNSGNNDTPELSASLTGNNILIAFAAGNIIQNNINAPNGNLVQISLGNQSDIGVQWFAGPIEITPSWTLYDSGQWVTIGIVFAREQPRNQGLEGDNFEQSISLDHESLPFNFELESSEVQKYTQQDQEGNWTDAPLYSIWFDWTPDAGNYEVENTGSTYLAWMSVYIGESIINSTYIDGDSPVLAFTADGDTTYKIQVGGFNVYDFGDLSLVFRAA